MIPQSLQSALPTASRRRREEAAQRPIASALALDGSHVLSINESHERCATLGLSRIGAPDFSPIPRADFAVARERNRRLFAHASPVMEMLFDQVAKTQSMVVLTDAQGTILHSIGDVDFVEKAATVALAPGVNWAECTKGTNAIGTALIDETSMLVHADEHFMHANHFLTCQASPLLDPRGNILGVLDVTGDRRGYHQHTMGLVKMSARMIENHWLNDDFRDALRLHFHHRPEFIGTLMEGILAVDADGRLLGANRSALELLGLSGAAVRMQNIASLLGTPIGTLVDSLRTPQETPLRLTLPHGQVVHAQLRASWSVGHAAWGGGGGGPEPSREPIEVVKPAVAVPLPAVAAARMTPEPSEAAPPPAPSFQRLLNGDPQIETAIGKLRRVLDRHIPILLLGEPGSGKELMARTIHAESSRRTQPFLIAHCASTSESALEAELFGYAEGVFPGARRQGAMGKLLQASGGTLFLDEVGGLPANLQARLLRVLQDQQVTPLGAAHPIPVDLSVVAATAFNPRELIDGQVLREDLYYRLNGLAVRLPPLRERGDLKALLHQVLSDEVPGSPPLLAPDIEALLIRHDWPGNLRQLINVLHTAAVMAAGEACITREHLPDDFLEEATGRLRIVPQAAQTPPPPHRSDTVAAPQGTLEEVERETIRQAVDQAGGNISVASKRLGISRNTIYRKLRWSGAA
jgi:transcriptional regulator of acetoin/glycerol metabolism